MPSVTPVTDEQFTTVAGGIRLCHRSFGCPSDPTALLIMGLGLSMDWWRDDFCRSLAARGFRVVRFDNRDVGRSTQVGGPGMASTTGSSSPPAGVPRRPRSPGPNWSRCRGSTHPALKRPE